MASNFIVEARSRNNDDRAPWLIVARENDRVYVLMDGDQPAVYDNRDEAEERLELIRVGKPDPEPPSNSSSCFLTSACAKALGEKFQDDGIELNTLRRHRDRLAQTHPELSGAVDEYYRVAPSIVERINSSKDPASTYQWIFDNMVIPTNRALDLGDDEAAVALYRRGFEALKEDYFP